MNKIVVGLIFGAVLGALDGATAWFTPAVRSLMASIMVGSTFKGMVVGLLSGWFAQKVNSLQWGIVVGSVLGLAFGFAVTAMPSDNGQHYNWRSAAGLWWARLSFLHKWYAAPLKRSS
jgi:hypothetical protein